MATAGEIDIAEAGLASGFAEALGGSLDHDQIYIGLTRQQTLEAGRIRDRQTGGFQSDPPSGMPKSDDAVVVVIKLHGKLDVALELRRAPRQPHEDRILLERSHLPC
jgi:hypothetical protein